MIDILLVDDHNIFREGLKKILNDLPDMAIAGEAKNGDEALKAINKKSWDLVLMDVSMPGKSPLEILTHARRMKLSAPFLMLTMHHDELLAMRFIKAGAKGYLTKDCDLEILIKAIRKVATGGRHITPDLADRIFDALDSNLEQPRHTRLSHREFTVLCKIASGLTISAIAKELSISISTASTYRKRILEKMDMKNSAELTNYALKNDLVH
ncbi:MAG: response regulator transcription factor [Magnetococcales bacterium]|nr:response regulator transcription factor [Magnetococcales bacterium]